VSKIFINIYLETDFSTILVLDKFYKFINQK
jgi:hypothetical protein